MKLSTRVRYACRALIVLAHHNEPCTSERIAQQEHLSKKYMDEILGALRQGGILATKRGVSGGYTISQHLEAVSLLEIIELLDGPIRLAPCVDDAEQCPREKVCLMNSVWDRLNAVIRDAFAAVSLRDIVERGDGCLPSLKVPGGICSKSTAV